MSDACAVLTLPIAAIAIPAKRIGYFDAKHAERLGEDMARDGQHDPIHVQSNGDDAWTLIAGLHRLRGLEGAGHNHVSAIVVADATASAADLARLELSENLDHRQRRPIERAVFMQARWRMEEELAHPGRAGEPSYERAARQRWHAEDTVSAAGWQARAAKALDCDERTVRRYVSIYDNLVGVLPADLVEAINFHPLCNSYSVVKAIASHPERERELLARTLVSRDDWKSLDAVFKAAGARLSTGRRPMTAFATFDTEWRRLDGKGRKAYVGHLADHLNAIEARHMVERLAARGLADIHRR